ncbi:MULTISPECIES: flippase [Halolamina]|uniref:Membrane protein involved in the export of O-antigen and teichoic acid n=1 Tax=Halolamina pelagica TaxID=699431 RepID=A0A1I5QYH0_9EURY|nr:MULTISPECIES: flippase [Halolamina]NHX35608.1 flippase [Halolamina sp. R1-12]SFP51293.1 Membrane protein involved in the export of O-antigen and teichoic acid [Halolamina pelagica]
MAVNLDDAFEKLFKGGGILFFGLVVELGVSFLAKALIARYLGPSNYGAVSLGITMLALLSTLSLLGLNTGVGRYLPRFDDESDRRGVMWSAFQIVLPVSVLVGVIVAVSAEPIATYAFHNPSIVPIIRTFGLTVPFAALMKLSVGGIQGVQLARPKVIVNNFTPPITRFTAVAIALVVGAGAVGIATAYALAYVAAALVGLYFVVRKTPMFSSVKPTSMHRELLSFSAPLIVSSAMGFVLTDLDTFMLGYFATTNAVGVYNVIYPLAHLLMAALTAFGFLFVPVISRLDAEGETEDMKRVYQVVTKWIFMATLPAFLVIALFPELTISMTFGNEYRVGATALSILSIAFFSHSIAGPNANVLTSIGRTRAIMWDNIVVAVVNTILNLLLIPRYGFLGAGIATAASYLLLNFLYSLQLYRETGIHPFSSGLVRPGLMGGGLVAVVAWVTRTYFTVTIPVLVAMFLVFLSAYGVVILRFGGVEEEEVTLVLSFEEQFGIDLGPFKTIAKALIKDR